MGKTLVSFLRITDNGTSNPLFHIILPKISITGNDMKKILLILLLATTVAHAEIYKWTDKEGAAHFSDSIGKVPANYRNTIQIIERDTKESTIKNKEVPHIEPPQSSNNNGPIVPTVDDLKNQIMKDEGIMALIREMQNDQELQVLLNNPEIMSAIQAGDITTLVNNPDFLKLLNNPRVKEIEKKLNQTGMK
jgi:hypothetical protein